MTYYPLHHVPPTIEYDQSHIHALAGQYQAFAAAHGDLLGATAGTADPTRYNQPLAADAIATHDAYNGIIGDGWGSAAQDQQNLSVDDQLQPDGVITGTLNDGEGRSSADVIGAVPGSDPGLIDRDPGKPLRPIHADLMQVQPTVSSTITGGRLVEPELMPWQAINDAVATGAAAEIYHEIGGPARIVEMDHQIRDLNDHVEQVRKAAGPQGPQGPQGPPGPEGPAGEVGPPGADGRDAQILI